MAPSIVEETKGHPQLIEHFIVAGLVYMSYQLLSGMPFHPCSDRPPGRRWTAQRTSGENTMNKHNQLYQWSKRDRVLHLLPAIPLALFYAGTVYLLAVNSIYLVGIFVLLWVATNVAIAGICTGCPYRGGYCPGISQLYFAPFLSAAMCKDQNSSARSFKINLALLGVFGIGSYLFAFYWLFVLYWSERAIVVLALLGLLVVHMPLSFFILCPKCGYNDNCPMAKVQKVFKTAQRAVQIDKEK